MGIGLPDTLRLRKAEGGQQSKALLFGCRPPQFQGQQRLPQMGAHCAAGVQGVRRVLGDEADLTAQPGLGILGSKRLPVQGERP